MECQVDYGKLGLMLDPVMGRRRTVHASIFTAVVSRHMFVWLSFRQTFGRCARRLRGRVGVLGGIFKVAPYGAQSFSFQPIRRLAPVRAPADSEQPPNWISIYSM